MRKHIRQLLDNIERKSTSLRSIRSMEAYSRSVRHAGFVQGLLGRPCHPPSRRKYTEEWIKGWKEGDADRKADARRKARMIFDLTIYKDDDELLFEFSNVSVVLGTGHGQSAVAMKRGDIVAKINTWDDNPVEIGLKSIRIEGNLMNAVGGNPGRGYWLLTAPKVKK